MTKITELMDMTKHRKVLKSLKRFGSRRWLRRTPVFGIIFTVVFQSRLDALLNLTIRNRTLLTMMEKRTQ